MKKNLALIFFSAALVILGFLGFAVLNENTNTTATEPSGDTKACQQTTEFKFPAGLQILWSDSKYFVSFDSEKKSIQLNSWSYINNAFRFDQISQLALTCEKPDYQCVAKDLKLSLDHFKPPFGLLTLESAGKKKQMPFSWDSKSTLRLGAPLQLCGKNFADISKGNLFWLQDKLYFYDYGRNIMGQFDMSQLNGAAFSSAFMDAQKVSTIVGEGFVENSSCDSDAVQKTADPYFIQTENDQVLIYKSNAVGIVYSYKNDFVPLYKTAVVINRSMKDNENKTLVFTDSKAIYKLSDEKLSEVAVETAITPDTISKISDNPSGQIVYSALFQKILSLNARRIFNSDQAVIHDLNGKQNFKADGIWSLYNKNIQYSVAGVLSAENFYYFSQTKNSVAEFTGFTCKN